MVLPRSLNLFFVCVLFVCMAVVMIVPIASSVPDVDAGAKVAEADAALRNAFRDVLDAEKNGVNVTQLAARLTEAGAVFAEAEVALNDGNSTGAVVLADSSKALADGVGSDAKALSSEAVAGIGGWWFPLLLSGAGLGLFLASLYAVWRWFRKYFARKLVDGRPEVST